MNTVSSDIDIDLEGFVEHVGSALQIDDAQVAGDLKEFARLLESNGFATGAWRGSVNPPPGSVGA